MEQKLTKRPNSPLEELIGVEIPVLDHGFIRVVDYLGNDQALVQSARVSYADGTKSIREDEGLIRFLMRNGHTSPFEMCELKLHCKMPIFVARQWVRHRMVNLNEVSARYSVLKDEFYIPDACNMAFQSKTNRQGRGDVISEEKALGIQSMLAARNADAYSDYEYLLDVEGLARELSRIVLPLNTYTEWYWKIDLHNLFHFLKLRTDGHAQYEIRAYADEIAKLVETWCPMAYLAWWDYEKTAVKLSGPQFMALKQAIHIAQYSVPVGVSDDTPRLSRTELRELEALFGLDDLGSKE